MALTRVGKGGLDKGSIKDQTNLGSEAADTDEFLIYDASADSLKAIESQNVVGPGIITNKDSLGEGASSTDQILVYDTSAGVLKKVTQSNFLNFPTVSSVSPTNLTSGDGTGNYTVVITGSGFTNATAKLLKSDNATEVSFDTVTVDSATQITGVIAKSSLANADEPFGVKVAAASGLNSQLNQQITIDAQPAWSTASGSIASIFDGARASGATYTVAAADPESGGDITYTLETGSLPAGMSGASQSSGYVISGTPTAVGSDTTSTFTIRAADVNSNTADREFSITVKAPTTDTFTSSGTFSVPSGLTTVNVLVVAGGGGGGGSAGAGGGAGGLIYRPAFPVTPGGTVTVTVGNGASGGGYDDSQNAVNNPATIGSDSVFGTLTAKGGGGGSGGRGMTQPATPGGSGGGARGESAFGSKFGQGIQPTQPGDSGTYGFGTNGGDGNNQTAGYVGGGGGGAGAAGEPASPGASECGAGGIGKAYNISGTSVYYAGGGGGSGEFSFQSFAVGGQGGGGNGHPTSGGAGEPGTANRGGGGGGGSTAGPNSDDGGDGGKGIVIVQY